MDHSPALSQREAMERVIADAEAVGDRSAPMLRAMAAFASELAKAKADAAAQHAALVEAVAAARQPGLSSSDLRQAFGTALKTHAGVMVKSLSWGVRLAATGILLAGIVVSGAAGYWQGYNSGVTDGSRRGLQANAVLSKLPPTDAALWAELVNDNPRIAEQVTQSCKNTQSTQDKRLRCDIAMWVAGAPTPGVH